jgi:hypothetical protein
MPKAKGVWGNPWVKMQGVTIQQKLTLRNKQQEHA